MGLLYLIRVAGFGWIAALNVNLAPVGGRFGGWFLAGFWLSFSKKFGILPLDRNFEALQLMGRQSAWCTMGIGRFKFQSHCGPKYISWVWSQLLINRR